MRKNLLTFSILVLHAVVTLAQAPNQSTQPQSSATSSKAVTTAAPPINKKADAQPAKQETPKAIAATETSFLKITINPSRSPISMDTAAGISAEIKNVSVTPVQLWENETVFMTMPETRLYGDSKDVIQGCATFPTQRNGAAERPNGGYDLVIQPGDSYRVFWDMTSNGCTGNPQEKVSLRSPILWSKQEWQRMMFTPGTYKVYLDVVLYPSGQQPYHTTSESSDVSVSASQQMVLLGAFLGGVLAYVIKLYYGQKTLITSNATEGSAKKILGKVEWVLAGLFAATMVILASRLSDAFPVSVNANDFWGSVTLGFVFQWIGVRLLAKLPGMSPGSAPSPSTEPAQPQPRANAPVPASTAASAVG